MGLGALKHEPEAVDKSQEVVEDLDKLEAANDDTELSLSVAEQKLWAKGGTDRDRLLADKQQLQKETEDRMRQLAADRLLPADQNAKLLKDIGNLGPEKLRLVQAHLEELAEEESEKNKELEPDDPKLLSIESKFKRLCRTEENRKYLGGEDSIRKHEEWIAKQRKENPSVKHLEECLDNFKNNPNADGLKKREVFYKQELVPKFKKYGFASPMTSDYIRKSGLSKRKQFAENINSMEKHLQTANSDLYSDQTIRTEMRTMLTEKDPSTQKQRIDEAKKCARIENANYTYLQKANNKVSIGKFTIPAMSERSMQFLLENHKREGVGSKKRTQSAEFWRSSK